MNDLLFWKVWSPSERRMAVAAFLVLVLSLILLVIKSIDPLGNVVQWNVLSESSEISAVVDVLQLGQWRYGISTPSHLVTETFEASMMDVNPMSIIQFWIGAAIGLSLILAALTTMPRFWYLAGMVLFILLLAFARLESLHIFGADNRIPFLVATLLYGGITYYFHAFRPDLGIAARILSMLGVAALLALAIAFGAKVPVPGFTATAYSYPLWLIITMVFLLVSATEIMAGLVWLSTSGKGRSGLIQFIVVSLLYLLLLLLIYLQNTRQIDWNVTLINPFYLALASGLLGIWGFRRRADSTKGVLPFRTTSFWLYMGLFIVAASFGALVAGTANDPVLETLEDVTVQGQLAMGLLFLFYILVNFWEVFRQKLAVYKVLYKPLRFGLTQTRLFGFAGLVVLFSMQRLLPLNQAIAGYFNGFGDVYSVTREFALAEQYYKLALQQEFQNHKSNYAMVSLALRQGDENAAAFYLRQSLLKNPSPQAYAALGNLLVRENLFFDAVYALREGIGRFPESGELLNNLGMLYSKTNVADSAYYYLERAKAATQRPEIPETNLLAILAKSTDPALLDSLTAQTEMQSYISWQANRAAVQNLKQDFSKQTFYNEPIHADSLLSVSTFAYLQNYAVNQARYDTLPARLFPKLAAKNPVFSEDLSLGAMYAEFYGGHKLKALEAMSALASEGGEKGGLYHKILGHWFLQLGLYDQAIEALAEVESIEGTIGVAIANALSGKKEVAVVLLDKIRDAEQNAAVEQLKQALFSGVRPKSVGDSLLAVAVKSPSAASFGRAVRANPFDARIVSAASEFYRRKKDTKRAYQLVLDALRYNEYAPELWEQYAYLSLEQGLLSQANEGADKVSRYALPAGYQRFLTRYQPMRALIEKQRADFQ